MTALQPGATPEAAAVAAAEMAPTPTAGRLLPPAAIIGVLTTQEVATTPVADQTPAPAGAALQTEAEPIHQLDTTLNRAHHHLLLLPMMT